MLADQQTKAISGRKVSPSLLHFHPSPANPRRLAADAILSNISDNFMMALMHPSEPEADQASLDYEVALIERLYTDTPSFWNEEKRANLIRAMDVRYQKLGPNGPPPEIAAALLLGELADASQNPLVKLVQRAGPRATATVESCKDTLASAETRDISYQQVANALLYMAILQRSQSYNAKIFVAALREHRTGQRLDWQDVVHSFDRGGLRITKPQFLSIYNALLPVATESDDFDIQLLWGGQWQNQLTQLGFLMCFLSCTPEELDVAQIPRLRASFTAQTFENAPDDIKAMAERVLKHPYVSLDATAALFNMIFRTSETYRDAQVLRVPEDVINPYTVEFLVSAVAVPKPWGALQERALKQLFQPYFTKKFAAYNFVLYGIWQQDRQWLQDRFNESYNDDPMSLLLILEHAQRHGWLQPLIRSETDISLELAAQAHARDLFDIEPWLQETFQHMGSFFTRILVNFLSTKANDEISKSRGEAIGPRTLPLAVKTVHPILSFLTDCDGLDESSLLELQRTCIQAYPRLVNYGEGVDDIIDQNGQYSNALPDDADKRMQEHFKNMYSGESDVRDIVGILKNYKTSQDPAEQDLFACMVHGLFDEYNCFGEYPLEALALTAVLFGNLINYNLLSRIALQVALAMVLEAVEKNPSEDSMYKFGLQALLYFSNRLSEWPNFCQQLLNVPSLQGSEIYPRLEEVVGHQVADMNGAGQNGLTNGTTMEDLLQPAEPLIPNFSCLHVDPPLPLDLYDEPDEGVQDKVMFALNNLSERNLHDKITELTSVVEDKYHHWFAGYIVEERAKLQPNYQNLYLDMLQLFNKKTLWAEVLRETYVAVIRMLNSEGTLGSTERGHLKQLGAWLGSLTLARDEPIKYRNISFKDLLIEGYDTDRLLLVIPFTCKVLVQAAKSTVFKYPNPWLVEIIRVLMELYHCADLKLNQKFEIEVLCKGLDIDHTTIEPSDNIRTRPQPEEEYLGPLQPEGLEPFSDLAIMSLNRGARGPSERFSSAAITATLPDLSGQLIYPPTANTSVPPNALQKVFRNAVSQAIQEIIAPVVERSVTIAAISTSQLITKDFAMEPDEEKVRTAAHTVVKSLSGALALVTCKEPLRMSIMNNIRLMARELPEQALPEGHVLMFVNDNLDLVCSTVEQAAEQSSVNEIDVQIEEQIRHRRMFRNTRPNEPFKDPNVSHWASFIPEPYRQTPGGLNREQLAIYEHFGQQSRGVPHANNISQDSGRQVPDVLQDQFAVSNLPALAATPAEPRPSAQQPHIQNAQGAQAPLNQQLANGFMESSVSERPPRSIEELVQDLTRNAKEAPEERLVELERNSPITEVFEELVFNIETSADKDTWCFRIAPHVLNTLFAEPYSRLEVEVFTRLLATLCRMSINTMRQVMMWLATMQDEDRFFNAAVMVCLMECGLMDLHRLNTTIAKALLGRRLAALEMLSSVLDDVLLNEEPITLRADFALSLEALTNWLAEDPDLEIGKQILSKLQVSQADQVLTPPTTGNKDQLVYVFDEWVHLQFSDTPKKAITAFIYQLYQSKVLETREDSVEFFRACLDASVLSYERQEFAPYGTGNPDTATVEIDALGKLIVSLVVYHGEQDAVVVESKAAYLDKILVVVILVLNHHQKAHGDRFNPKVFFRLFSTILCELNDAVKDRAFAAYKSDMFLAVARAFLVLQPQTFPLFTFQWLALISHRIFIPAMLEDSNTKDSRWDAYAQLMETLLNYTGQVIRPTGETMVAQHFYRGVLRVLLVIHHDYPEFLAENHFRFCNSIPMHCTQLRNLIVSAFPSNMLEMPDPFAGGLKSDRLEEMRQAPVIRASIDKMLGGAGIKNVLDGLMTTSDAKMEDVERVCSATYFAAPKPAGFEQVPTTADPKLLHAIVLYIGTADLASQGSKAPNFDPASSAAKLLENLVKQLRPEAKFHFISAIANQLRWPNAHTHYFSHALLHLFGPPNKDPEHLEVQEVITRVLLERLLVHRPHPWGLIVTLLEILKNDGTYSFWSLPFVKAAPEVCTLLYRDQHKLTGSIRLSVC